MANQPQAKVVRRKKSTTGSEQRIEDLLNKKSSSFGGYFWTLLIGIILGAVGATLFVSETQLGADILATGQGQSRAVLTDSLTRQNQRISNLEHENLILKTKEEILDSLIRSQNHNQQQNLRQQQNTRYRNGQYVASRDARQLFSNLPPVPVNWTEADLVSATWYDRHGVSHARTGKGEVAIWVGPVDKAGETVFVKPTGTSETQWRSKVFNTHIQLEPYTEGDSIVGWVERTYDHGNLTGSSRIYRTM